MEHNGKKILAVIKDKAARKYGVGGIVYSAELKDYINKKVAIVVYDEEVLTPQKAKEAGRYINIHTGERFTEIPEGEKESHVPVRIGFRGLKENVKVMEEIELEKELKKRLGTWVETEDGRLEVKDGVD